MARRKKGWFGESKRHRIAAKKGKKGKNSRRRLDFPKGKGLTVKAVIYVPSTRAANKPISSAQFKRRIKEAQRFFTNTFGGTTKVSAYGTYVSEKKGVIGEKVAKVEVFCNPKDYYYHDEDIKRFVKNKKREWGQESISYEYKGSMHFV